MKPTSFDYVKAESIEAAIHALERFGEDARILAGGQSLMPLMNMRMLRPSGIVDINSIPGLDGIRLIDGRVRIGALTRYVTIEHSDLVEGHLPLLFTAIRKVADRQVRNRGTLGGSICHADPAAQMPLCALTLGARMILCGPTGERSVPAEDFFQGPYTTAVKPFEVLTGIDYPDCAGHVSSLVQQTRKHGDFPVVSVAMSSVRNPEGLWKNWCIGVCGLALRPVLLKRAAALLEAKTLSASLIEEAANLLEDDVDPPEDLRASSQYRLHLVPIYIRRAIAELAGDAYKQSTDER